MRIKVITLEIHRVSPFSLLILYSLYLFLHAYIYGIYSYASVPSVYTLTFEKYRTTSKKSVMADDDLET